MSWTCAQGSVGSFWQCSGYVGTDRTTWSCSPGVGGPSWDCSGTTHDHPSGVSFSCSSPDGGSDWSCGEVAGDPDMTWQPFMQPS